MKVSEILKVVKDCERLRDILMRGEELTSEDTMRICDLLMYASLPWRDAYLRAVKDRVLTKYDRELVREFHPVR